MTKPSPFDYVKSINFKTYMHELVGYTPFLTNKSFAMHLDTILIAEEMNQAHHLSPELQYDFYYYAVRKGKRFGFPPKPQDDTNVELVMEYYNYSRQKAMEVLPLLTPMDLRGMMKTMDKGGR